MRELETEEKSWKAARQELESELSKYQSRSQVLNDQMQALKLEM